VIFFEEFVRVKPHYKKDLLRTFYWNIQVFSFLYFRPQMDDGRTIKLGDKEFRFFFGSLLTIWSF
jgi:hypothetical protein